MQDRCLVGKAVNDKGIKQVQTAEASQYYFYWAPYGFTEQGLTKPERSLGPYLLNNLM